MSDNPNKPAPEKMLQLLIERKKQEAFIRPAAASDEEGLALLVSHWCEWEGERIVKVFLDALEDANYHTFRSKVLELWQQVEAQTESIHAKLSAQAEADKQQILRRFGPPPLT